MSYVLVNVSDGSREFRINYMGWMTLRWLLVGAGWEPKGATGHEDTQTGEPVTVPSDTFSDRWCSYEGCSFQLVCAEDAGGMAMAAHHGIMLCESNPEGTFDYFRKIWSTVLCDRDRATDRRFIHPEHEWTAEYTPENCRKVIAHVKGLLQEFAEFAAQGEFYID